MKRGLIFGGAAWALSLFLIIPFLTPLIFPNADMRAMGRLAVPFSFFVVALPAFLVGYFTRPKGL